MKESSTERQEHETAILDKVKKLLALAGNNSNEQEAGLAMQRAQEILAKYNLSLGEVHAHSKKQDGRSEQEKAAVGRTKKTVARSAMFQYQRDLWSGLAETNWVTYYPVKISSISGVFITYHHYVLGREENVAVVEAMAEYLEQWINRACPYKVGKDVNRWKLGATERIVERLRENQRNMEDGDSHHRTGVVVSKETAVALRTVRESEMHANYLFQNGNSNWCPCRVCLQRRREEREQWKRDNPEPVVRAESQSLMPEKTETEAEKKKRQEREARLREKWARERARINEKEWEIRGSEAFQKGKEDGETVNLNEQIKEQTRKGEGR